jgi:ABC-type lipoprotein release transport system permease subunit
MSTNSPCTTYYRHWPFWGERPVHRRIKVVTQFVLFNVEMDDPISIVVALTFVLAVAIVAAFIPTVRAVYLDPASILRES